MKLQYDLQTEYLQNNTPFFIATYMVKPDPIMGKQISYCTWTYNCPSLLPLTDFVGFTVVPKALSNAIFKSDYEQLTLRERTVHVVAVASWQCVMDVVGYRMENTDYTPPRYRVTTFPSSAEIQRLGFCEIHG